MSTQTLESVAGHRTSQGSSAWSDRPEVFEASLEAAPDAIVIVDQDGRIALVNGQVEALFGYDRSALLGQPVEVLVPDRLHDVHEQHRDRYLASPHLRPMGVGLDLLGRRKDGTEFPVEISLSPVHTQHGDWVTAVIRDTTARKRTERELRTLNAELEERARRSRLAEAALSKSEALLRSIVESTPDSIYIKNLQGAYLMINTSGARLLNRSMEEVIGKTDRDLLPEEIALEMMEADTQVKESGVTQTCEETTRSWGRTRTYLTTRGLIRDGGGERIGVFGISRDITSRKREEERLRAAEARYRTIFEQLPIITYVGDMQSYIVTLSISPTLEMLCGFRPEDVDDPELWSKHLHPEDRDRVLSEYDRVRNEGQPTVSEYRFRTGHGTYRSFREFRVLHRDESGAPQFVQGVMLDLG